MPPRFSAARGPPGRRRATGRRGCWPVARRGRRPRRRGRAGRRRPAGPCARPPRRAGRSAACRGRAPSRTSWNTVCPGETTRCGGRSSIAMVVSTASATAWPMRWSRKHSAAADVVAGGSSARICSRSPSGQGCERHSTVSMLTLLSSRPRSTTATSRSSAEVPDATAHTLIAVPPPAGRRRRGRDRRCLMRAFSAVAASTRARIETRAVFARQPAASSATRASSSVTPVASVSIRCARRRSFSLDACTSIIQAP